MAEAGDLISFDKAMEIETAGVMEVYVDVEVKGASYFRNRRGCYKA